MESPDLPDAELAAAPNRTEGPERRAAEGTVGIFAGLADVYDDVLPFFATCGRRFAEWLAPTPGTRWVDLGAGRGAVSGPVAARGAQVLATDAAPAMLRRLRCEHPGIGVAVMDARSLALAPGSADAVTAAFLIHLVDGPERVLAEAVRVLRPGGVLALAGFEPSADGPAWQRCSELLRDFWQYARPGARPPWRPVDPDALLRDAGLGTPEVDVFTVHLPFEEPDLFWQWMSTQGQRVLVEALPENRRRELRALLHAEVSAMNPREYQRGVAFRRVRTPD